MFSQFFIERPIFAAVVAITAHAGRRGGADRPCRSSSIPTSRRCRSRCRRPTPAPTRRRSPTRWPRPIEAQINGVDNMLYMSSTSSSTGQMTLTVYFSLDTDPDIAQVQVQNRVNLAMPQLPAAVVQQGVSVQKKSSSIMMLVAVFAKDGRYSPEYVANYANVYVLDALKRVQGAGQAQVMGVADQAMRIWMNPDRMASLGITTTDIQNAVAAQNALFGAGQVGQQPNAGAGGADLPGGDPAAVHRAQAVREDHPAGEPGRQRDRARRRRRPRRGRAAAVHRRQPAEQRAGDLHRRLPAAGRQRPDGVQGGAQDARGDEEPRFPTASTTRSRSTPTISCACRSRR